MSAATKIAAASTSALHAITWRTPRFLVMLGLFLFYYFWIVQPGMVRGVGDTDYYNLLTDAFLAGQTSLLEGPSPELLSLPDPYDSAANQPYRKHDFSLYKGRYYLYFGATPAVTLFAPFRLLTTTALPQRLGALYFAFLAFVVACLLLKMLLAELLPRTRRWMYYTACCVLGFVNSFPHLLRRPAVYEVAISAGQFYMMCAIYVVCAAVLKKGWATGRRLLLGGVALGLAFGARPTMLFVLPVAALLLVFPVELSTHQRRRNLAVFAAGFALIAGCVAIYNWNRFDSPFQFGNTLQLAAFDSKKIKYFSAERVPANLWFYVACPPAIKAKFPFVFLEPDPPPYGLPPNFLGPEDVEGILFACPIVLILPFLTRIYRGNRRREFLAITCSMAAAGFVLMVFTASLAATMRYLADFSPLIAIASLLGWVALLDSSRRRRLALAGFLVLAGLGVANQWFIAFTGYYNTFQSNFPEQFNVLETIFSPVAGVLGAILN